ncbi:hypothetical protein KFL_000300080 [Klebsormidium nitens]|uniref:Uncharacterized protein n=1 Tax=Klebsormidium nitens TaxID=105231 RepID=A0A0U9HI21_KLENI|nr:hypothetical protein KFL_000300080 [Klebsormidium nitens]|eukprot:GAQ79410.1 hypothetical protein KFL_000300080 [Klebsormidium nitens]
MASAGLIALQGSAVRGVTSACGSSSSGFLDTRSCASHNLALLGKTPIAGAKSARNVRRGLKVRAEDDGAWQDPITTGISKTVEAARNVVKTVRPAVQTDPKNLEHGTPYPIQQQGFPGDEYKMDPRPDYGRDSYKGHNRLQDKIAIVTGGDSGIGRAVALAYAREGAHLVIPYLNEHEDAKEIKEVIEQEGRDCTLIPGDLSKEEQCQKVIDDTLEKYGRIDILVNNASFQGKHVNHLEEITRDRLEFAFDTNIIAMFRLATLAYPHMRPGSSIINTTSIVAYQPIPGILDYVCTKGAIVSFTKGLAEMLMVQKGIRVNAVAPGPIWTPITVESFTEPMVAGFGGPQTPTERAAQPKELAPIYVLLASEEASFMNGCVYGVTGGLPIN